MCTLFLAVKSKPDVDLAAGVNRKDDAVRIKPFLERTCRAYRNIHWVHYKGTNNCASHTQCVGEQLLWKLVSMTIKQTTYYVYMFHSILSQKYSKLS